MTPTQPRKRPGRASTFAADLLGMLALSVIVLGCLHLPTLI